MSLQLQKWRTFETVMKQIVEGEITPPNLEPMSPEQVLYALATFGHSYRSKHGLFRNAAGTRCWGMYYFGAPAQGIQGRNDGTGFVIQYNGGRPEAAYFAICKHVKSEEGHSPNHIRGWHPGHCEKCGLDLTYDSSD